MNRIASRTKTALLLALLLVAGLVFFLAEYAVKSPQWVTFPGSPHVYKGGNLDCGIITDREGVLLLDSTESRVYSKDESVRRSTLHLMGDRYGYISAPALAAYSSHMVGFDRFNGLYASSGTGGQAVLTVSAKVQAAALEAMKGKKGVVAVYNYETGEILCALSCPNYDPDNVPDIKNDDTGAYDGVYVNRFTQSSYTPGSIFKIVTTAAALNEIPDIESRSFICDGSLTVGSDEVICAGNHGKIKLDEALRRSCNCAFAQIAMELGPEKLKEYVKNYSLTEPVTFDSITTAKGSFEASTTSDYDLAWSGIGQHTDLVNPCRYMLFMGQIAGGGTAAKPYLVSSVTSGGHNGYSAKAEMADRIMSTSTALRLQELMRQCVVKVYGNKNFPDIEVCAKSGTAQVGKGLLPTATFSGYCLDEDYPLAFVVFVEDAGSGSEICVPILSKVLRACVEVMDEP